MTVNGDVTFLPGSTFQAEVDGRNYDPAGGAGTYDRLVVTGATSVVSLNGTIRPVLRGMAGANNNFVPRIGDVFRVIEATDNASAISGEFANSVLRPNGIKAGTRFSVIYGADYVDLAIVPDDFGTFMKATITRTLRTRAGRSRKSTRTGSAPRRKNSPTVSPV